MNKSIASFGLLAVGGGLSLCGLCGTGIAAAPAQPIRAATASPFSAPVNSSGQFVEARVASVVKTQTVTFKIVGMTCGGCVIGVRKVLTRLPGVSKATVTYEESRATVMYDPAKVTVQQMTAAIATLGYKATVTKPIATS